MCFITIYFNTVLPYPVIHPLGFSFQDIRKKEIYCPVHLIILVIYEFVSSLYSFFLFSLMSTTLYQHVFKHLQSELQNLCDSPFHRSKQQVKYTFYIQNILIFWHRSFTFKF